MLFRSGGFLSGRTKLGLGSSAAVTVAAVASVFHEAGRSLQNPEDRRELWRLCHRIHNEFQKNTGSGADLAASIFGGRVVFRPGSEGSPPAMTPHPPFPTLPWTAVWSGSPARTPKLVDAVRRFRARESQVYHTRMEHLRGIAEGLIAADPADTARCLDLLDAYGEGMEELGRASGVPILTQTILSIRTLARRHGGTAKPSGAGGGDLVLAFFPGEEQQTAFRNACTRKGYHLPDLHIAEQGVRVSSDGTEGRKEKKP